MSKIIFHDGIELRPIPDFPDYYASADGNVWSRQPMRGHPKKPDKPRLLKKHITGSISPYWAVMLYRNGRGINKRVGDIVLTTFVSPRPNGMVICHGINGRYDDSLENLSWGTRSKNQGEDRVRDGTINRGEKHNLVKLNELQVRIIRRCYSFHGMNGVNGEELAKIFNVNSTTIYDIVKRKSWTHI